MAFTKAWLLLPIVFVSSSLFLGCNDKQVEQAKQAAAKQADLDRVKGEIFAKYSLRPSLVEWARLPESVSGTSMDDDLRWLHQQMIKGGPPSSQAERDALLDRLLSLARAESGKVASLEGTRDSYFSLPDGSVAVGPEWQEWCRLCAEQAVNNHDCELLGTLSQAHVRIAAALFEAAEAPKVANAELRRLMGAASIASSLGIRLKCDAAACTRTDVEGCKTQSEHFNAMLLQLRSEIMAASGAP